MNSRDVIRAMLKSKRMTQITFASMLGITQAGLSARLTRPGISASTFQEMVDLLGYEIVLQPKDLPASVDSYVLTLDDRDEYRTNRPTNLLTLAVSEIIIRDDEGKIVATIRRDSWEAADGYSVEIKEGSI